MPSSLRGRMRNRRAVECFVVMESEKNSQLMEFASRRHNGDSLVRKRTHRPKQPRVSGLPYFGSVSIRSWSTITPLIPDTRLEHKQIHITVQLLNPSCSPYIEQIARRKFNAMSENCQLGAGANAIMNVMYRLRFTTCLAGVIRSRPNRTLPSSRDAPHAVLPAS
ncbi:hypothetical protein BDR07DRAFT_184417 [Suillus spraguei]|nr:hypothetical protein BDR07DRAFT_184417 [Suillus spraguei]